MAKLTKLSQEEQDNVIYDARFGDLESLKDIFDKEVEPETLLTIQDEYSFSTPFHMASANGHNEVLKYLLSIIPNEEDKKKVLNKENDNGNTALHWAAYNGNLEIVKTLCENGADPFIRNKYSHDSFHEASNNDQEEVEDYLLEKYGNIVEEEIDDNDSEDGADAKEDAAKTGEAAEEEKEQEGKVQFSKGTEIISVTETDKTAINALSSQTGNLSL